MQQNLDYFFDTNYLNISYSNIGFQTELRQAVINNCESKYAIQQFRKIEKTKIIKKYICNIYIYYVMNYILSYL